jgi:hypothetical protein
MQSTDEERQTTALTERISELRKTKEMNSVCVRRRVLWHARFGFLNVDVDNSAFLVILRFVAGNLLPGC